MRDENFERAVNELRTHQQQMDQDGIVVGVSREALTDVLNEIEALTGDFNDNVDRLKACEHIAEGDEGWEKLRNECPSTAAVARLRERLSHKDAALKECSASYLSPPCTAQEAAGHLLEELDRRAQLADEALA